MKKQYKEEIERLGWWIEEGDKQIEIGQHSPAGEDFSFCIDPEDPVGQIRQYADSFDPDEHATMWIEARGHVSGVPTSIRDLIEDAEEIEKMLKDLADALEQVPKTTRKKKYKQGAEITSIGELCEQEFIVWHSKIYHRGFFLSWTMKFAVDKLRRQEFFKAEITK